MEHARIHGERMRYNLGLENSLELGPVHGERMDTRMTLGVF